MLSRFLPSNIMHCLHDDLIPLYHTMVERRQRASAASALLSEPDVDSGIMLADGHAPGDYFFLLQLFSDHPIIHQRDLSMQTVHVFSVRVRVEAPRTRRDPPNVAD